MTETGMSASDFAALIGVGIVALGLLLTWIRNSKSQTKHISEMEGRTSEQILTIFNKLDDPNTGLGAISKSVEDQKVHCAGVVGRFDERLNHLEEQGGKKTKGMSS